MAGKWGSVDIKQLKELQKRMDQLERIDREKLIEGISKELAARLLAKVIKRTPVGQYPAGSGKKGGTLRRGWTSETEEAAAAGSGRGEAASKYAERLRVEKKGNVYEIEIINPVHYASYVEFGHRTRGHKSWVDGQFMLTISEKEVDAQAPKVIERRIQKALEEVFK